MNVLKSSLLGQMILVFSLLLLSVAVPAAKAPMEKLKVIGSHIKRTQIEGPSPITVIDREQIERSGYSSVVDVLKDLPVAIGGFKPAHPIHDFSSTTSITVRGMGAEEILFLINGRRMVSMGGSNTVDLSVIPVSVIERIEILKDGGSALYGGDAVGGVINIVTKKDDKGGRLIVQTSLSQRRDGGFFQKGNFDYSQYYGELTGLLSFLEFVSLDNFSPNNNWDLSGKGDVFSVSASYGDEIGDMNYLMGGEVRLNTSLYYKDRSFAILSDVSKYSSIGSPGSWSDDDGLTWHAAPGCPQARIKASKMCGFDYSPYMQISPSVLKTSAFFQADQEVGDWNLEGLAIYTLNLSHRVLAPAPDRFAKETSDKPDHTIPLETATQKMNLPAKAPIQMYYRLVEELGSRKHLLQNHFLQTHLSAMRPIGDMEFEGNINLGGNYYFDHHYAGYANKETLFNMINAGSFNPAALPGQKSDVSQASLQPWTSLFSGIASFEPKLTGELLDVKGQPLMFAVGGIGAGQYYSMSADAPSLAGNQWGGSVPSDGSGYRGYTGFYEELSILLANTAELQVAGRTDYYSDFGLTWQELNMGSTSLPLPLSPRMSLTLQPIKEVKLVASWGLAYKTPSLAEMYANEHIDHLESRDFVLCPVTPNEAFFQQNKDKEECNSSTQYITISKGNPNLHPEFANTLNMGIVLEPVPEFSMRMDYYRTHQTQSIKTVDIEDILKFEKKYGSKKLIEDFNIYVMRDAANRIKQIMLSPANTSEGKIHGLDLTADLALPITATSWDMGLSLEHLHILYKDKIALPGSDVETVVPWYSWMQNMLGVINAEQGRQTNISDTPRWRNRMTLSFVEKDKGYQVDMIVHYIPSYLQRHESSAQELVDHYWQWDVRGSLNISKKSRFILGVKNVLNMGRPENPEISTNTRAGNVDMRLYDPLGRTIDAHFTYDF